MSPKLRTLLSVSLLLLSATQSFASSVRIDLPDLLGDYTFDQQEVSAPENVFGQTRLAVINTQYGPYSISNAKLVIEGTVSAGRAHGDGLLLEPTAFDLVPTVTAYLNSTTSFLQLNVDPVLGTFHIENNYIDPYRPILVPIPGPDPYPPITIAANAFIGLNSFATPFPPSLTSSTFPPVSPPRFATDGMIVDEPIRGTITNAYLILNGPGVVPEPSTATLFFVAFPLLLRRRAVA